jgi:RimJ/RimL family protein N-acetyltransferase
MSIFKLVSYDKDFLNLSWIWLNDPEIKKLTNTPDFTRESQKIWFDTINLIENYLIWGIEFQNIKIGVCGLKNITIYDCEYWGFIGEKAFWNKGVGTMILKEIVRISKDKGLKSIWLKVISTNHIAINFYQKFGFISDPFVKDDLIIMRIHI